MLVKVDCRDPLQSPYSFWAFGSDKWMLFRVVFRVISDKESERERERERE